MDTGPLSDTFPLGAGSGTSVWAIVCGIPPYSCSRSTRKSCLGGTWGCCQITGAWWPLGTAGHCSPVAVTPGAAERLQLVSSDVSPDDAESGRQGLSRAAADLASTVSKSLACHFDIHCCSHLDSGGPPQGGAETLFLFLFAQSLEKALGFVSGFVLCHMLWRMRLGGCRGWFLQGASPEEEECRHLPPPARALLWQRNQNWVQGLIPNYHKWLILFPSSRDPLSPFSGRAAIWQHQAVRDGGGTWMVGYNCQIFHVSQCSPPSRVQGWGFGSRLFLPPLEESDVKTHLCLKWQRERGPARESLCPCGKHRERGLKNMMKGAFWAPGCWLGSALSAAGGEAVLVDERYHPKPQSPAAGNQTYTLLSWSLCQRTSSSGSRESSKGRMESPTHAENSSNIQVKVMAVLNIQLRCQWNMG